MADGQPIAVLVRGDHEANEGKIRRACLAAAGTAALARKVEKLELAPAEVIEKVTGAPVGFAGPVRMKEKIPILADRDVQKMVNAVTGANAADAHLTGVNLHRDFEVDLFADLRKAIGGDPCPRCSATLALRHAIEVGHVFKLGTKYTEALGAKFLDADEQLKPIIMGCYGIGVNRIIAGLIETSYDKDGIIWPMSLAPYEVVLTLVKVPDEASMKVAQELHDKLTAAGDRRSVGRPRLPGGREVQGRRPDRRAAAGGDRRARPEGRQARGEVAMGEGGREDRSGRRRRDAGRSDPPRAGRQRPIPRAAGIDSILDAPTMVLSVAAMISPRGDNDLAP